MECTQCRAFMFFSDDANTCNRCQKKNAKLDGLRDYYRFNKGIPLKDAVLDCRRYGLSLRKIAKILDRDLQAVIHVYENLKQDAS